MRAKFQLGLIPTYQKRTMAPNVMWNGRRRRWVKSLSKKKKVYSTPFSSEKKIYSFLIKELLFLNLSLIYRMKTSKSWSTTLAKEIGKRFLVSYL